MPVPEGPKNEDLLVAGFVGCLIWGFWLPYLGFDYGLNILGKCSKLESFMEFRKI